MKTTLFLMALILLALTIDLAYRIGRHQCGDKRQELRTSINLDLGVIGAMFGGIVALLVARRAGVISNFWTVIDLVLGFAVGFVSIGLAEKRMHAFFGINFQVDSAPPKIFPR